MTRSNETGAHAFLLDEDLPPASARIARALGVEAVSVHELGRTGHTDAEHLVFASVRRMIVVTRNRDDFVERTKRAFATNQPHHGVLVIGRRTPNTDPERIAHAIAAWAKRYEGHDPGTGFIDFP